MANEIAKQLKKCVAPPDVKVFLLLSVIRPLHAKWMEDLYYHLKTDKEVIVNGFRAAEISEAIGIAQDITEKVGNPFIETLDFFSFFLYFFKAKIEKVKVFLWKENLLCTSLHVIFPFPVIIQK